jgi:thiol-disulfide isomerase/thioredoxin
MEGPAKPVYFTADDVVFTDSLDPRPHLSYHAPHWLYRPCTDIVYLERGKMVKAYITGPTIFTMNQKPFLVNPRDKIRVTTDSTQSYSPNLSSLKRKKVRNRELQMLKHFIELEKIPTAPRLLEYNYQMIQNLEFDLKSQVIPAERASQVLFDSLSTAYAVSRKFKKSTKEFIHHRYINTILGLYWQFRDTLFSRKVYYEKVREHLPHANNLSLNTRMNSNMESHINYLNTSLYPSMGISSMIRQGRFTECFDTLSSTFAGPARDLLLSRLMYHAYTMGYDPPMIYERKYHQFSINKDYRKILARTKRVYDTTETLRPVLPDSLILADGKTTTHWATEIKKYKGKYILIDFWASWCVPCLNDLPFLYELKKQYNEDKIVFLSMSVDSNTPEWRSKLIKLNSDTTNNFLFVHPHNASIIQKLGLDEIPRYILIDPDGNMTNMDLPGPQDPELRKILNDYLKE